MPRRFPTLSLVAILLPLVGPAPTTPSNSSPATTSASSATRWPTACSTTAGSRRYLHSRFPKHDLVVRNLGFSGDELTAPAPLEGLRHAPTSG